MERAAPSRAERQAGRAAASEQAGRPARRFSPVNFRDVTITGAFWRERLDTVLTRTIPSQHEQLERERDPGIAGPSQTASAAAHSRSALTA